MTFAFGMGWFLIAAIAFVVFMLLLGWCLCRAAADGDRMLEQARVSGVDRAVRLGRVCDGVWVDEERAA